MCLWQTAADETSALHPTIECTVKWVSNYLITIDAITHLPEVDDDEIALGVATIVGVLLPVFDINISNAANQQFQLSFVEDIDQICWNELMEASHKRIELLFDPLLDTPLCNQPVFVLANWSAALAVLDSLDIFLLVLIVDLDIPTSRLEVNRDLLTKSLVFDAECAVDDICNVVLHRPRQRPMELCIHTLHIL